MLLLSAGGGGGGGAADSPLFQTTASSSPPNQLQPPHHSYESWIIYNFTSLLLAYVGGPGAVVVKAEGKVVHPSWTHLTCCLPAMQVGACACVCL